MLNNDYVLDNLLDDLFISIYPQPTYIKLKNIYALLTENGYQIESIILNKINNEDIDNHNINSVIIHQTKLGMQNLLKENNILVELEMATLDMLYNILYTIYYINTEDPYLLVPYSNILNNDDLSNIDKLASIVDLYTPSLYTDILNILYYVPDTLINILENSIDDNIEIKEDSDIDVLEEYSSLSYVIIKEDPAIKQTSVYLELINGSINTNLVDNTATILKYVKLYEENSITLKTLANIVMVYLIVTGEEDLYNLYLDKVVYIILQDVDELTINELTSYINSNLNRVLDQLNKG